jgi:ADP-heptose:LPS heptosyltransferase
MVPTPKSILVYVGGDLVGDAIMKLPFVRALRQAWPAAHITWCAGKNRSAFARELAPLITGLIDEVIEEAGFHQPLSLILRRPLSGRHFDLVIDTQRGVGTTLLLHRLRHGHLISGTAGFLFSGVRPRRGYRRPAAMVGQMTDLIALASGKPVEAAVRLTVDAGVEAAAAVALPAGPVYVGLAPGAGGRHKCWPQDNFIALARQQQSLDRAPVFILGPGEADMVETLQEAVPDARFPTVGPDGTLAEPSIPFTIALGQRLAAAVANDSGAGHILAAADTNLVSLFGPTPAAKFAPTAKRLEIIDAATFGSEAMIAIPVDAVSAAIDNLII